jgi:hypothetical protein
MSERQSLVRVFPNRWLVLDPSGKPICTVPRDFKEDGPGWIGARFSATTKEIEFLEGPAKCRATRYTRDRVVAGELFPATAEDAKVLRVPFVDPLLQLAEAKARAIVQYDAQFGAGAWAEENESAVILPAPESPKEPIYTLVEPEKTQPAKAAKAERKS